MVTATTLSRHPVPDHQVPDHQVQTRIRVPSVQGRSLWHHVPDNRVQTLLRAPAGSVEGKNHLACLPGEHRLETLAEIVKPEAVGDDRLNVEA